MAKYILNPAYGDGTVIILGSSLKTIKEKLIKHWNDELTNPENYGKNHIENINLILNTEHDSVDDLQQQYNELIDEDYYFEMAD